MHLLAVATLAALAAAPEAASAPTGAPAAPALPAGLIELEGRPLRVAVLERDGDIDVLLLRDRELERFRLEGRSLARRGAFRSPPRRSRPLLLDAAANPAGGDPLVAVVFGEDVQSVDQGTDTWLHAFVLSAQADGGLSSWSDDLRAYLRITGGKIHLQRRGTYELVEGPVRPVEESSGRYLPTRAETPWAARWLLDATPLPGGREALAWDGTRPMVVKLERFARVPGGSILGDLGNVVEPQVAIRLERPLFRMGMDKEGKVLENWHPVPRRVIVATDGAAYTVLRERTKGGLLGRASGQDAVVRLDWSGGQLSVSRPYAGVEAFVLDFALVERSGGRPAALLLVNDKDDGSGRAHLLFQEPR